MSSPIIDAVSWGTTRIMAWFAISSPSKPSHSRPSTWCYSSNWKANPRFYQNTHHLGLDCQETHDNARCCSNRRIQRSHTVALLECSSSAAWQQSSSTDASGRSCSGSSDGKALLEYVQCVSAWGTFPDSQQSKLNHYPRISGACDRLKPAPFLRWIGRKVQKLYPASVEVGIMLLSGVLGLKCGNGMPGGRGVMRCLCALSYWMVNSKVALTARNEPDVVTGEYFGITVQLIKLWEAQLTKIEELVGER